MDDQVREWARALSLRRKVTEGVCIVCGKPFQTRSTKRLYCSNACNQRAVRAKKRTPTD